MTLCRLRPGRDLTNWHRWFAWRPVRCDRAFHGGGGVLVWAEWVERRCFGAGIGVTAHVICTYRRLRA